MNLDSFIRLLPAGFEMTLADVGSAGGLKDRWAPARGVVSALMFEPREDAAQPRIQGRDTFYPIALGAGAGRAALNLTALPNMSSTLTPNAALMGTFRKKVTHSRVLSTLDMPVDSLDALLARERRTVDALKVDTQGSELDILQGARTALESTVLQAEVEVSFLERYEGQPLVGDVVAFMRGFGFDLLDIHRQKRYRALNSSKVVNPGLGRGQRAGRIAYGDGFFVLNEAALAARIAALPKAQGETLALKAMLGLLVYGKADIAARLLDLSGEALEPARRAALGRWFRRLGSSWAPQRHLHHLYDYLARNA